ncbi:putative F-box domain-containing protein [Rosa chinensis]|uniref:Putative F-box domain-containing protein n=1 Tax=Rosa chinensis TaxID=74649 RepID=A0A2P6RLI3_ROSCH|nr:F-box protein SKIP23 isoform X2 [Rosa chinensis]PRQ47294.1 putative F-box domain-containing protein [Rosa chinensis]
MQRPKLQWCDLPKELWQMIGKFLETRVDVLRFRSVCSLWRSAVRPLDPIDSPPLPLGFPHAGEEPPAAVSQTTVYRLQSLIAGEGSDGSLPFLVKFEEANCGEMRLLHPITNWQLRVVVLPADHLSLGEDFVVFMIYRGGHLAVMRYGDEGWIRVDENNSHYDDLIVYKGQCYVVDKWGTISWISQALQVIQYSPPLCGFGAHKHLVECCGDLCVVDRYLGSEPQRTFNYIHCDGEVVDFKVYRLDEEWATWVNVTNLGDQVIILSYDGAFSVSTRDFPGVKGNCIMFTEQDFGPLPAVIGMPSRSHHRRVFDLQDGSMSKIGYSQLFRTPSNWLTN